MPEQENVSREPDERLAVAGELYRTVSMIPWQARTHDESELLRTIARLNDRLLPRLLRPGSVSNRERRLADPEAATAEAQPADASDELLNGAPWSAEQEQQWRRETERQLVEAEKRRERRRAEARELLNSLDEETRARLLQLYPWLGTGL